MVESSSIFSSSSEKRQWVTKITELLNRDDLQKALESPPAIFRLPASVQDDNPQPYSPRRVALGPYHHFQPELYKMELYKLEKAKKVQQKLHLPEFHQLQNELKLLDLRIRECFDKFLEMDDEMLTWMMVVDGLFLLRLLVAVSENRVGGFGELNFPLSNFDEEKFYPSMDKEILTHYEILSDVLKLENQIPCLVLQQIYPNESNTGLAVFLYDFYTAVSPFLGENEVPPFRFSNAIGILEQSHHLLHFLYLSILFIPTIPKPSHKQGLMYGSVGSSPAPRPTPLSFFQICLNVLEFALNLPFIPLLKQAIELILVLLDLLKAVIKPCFDKQVFPTIPSASELEKVKVKFEPASNKILDARFDKDSATVFLPVVSIDALSEVVLRNLVAFEAISEVNPPCLVEYISLMSGFIVTTKDVKILKEENIICSQFESDEQVVEFFNGIKNSSSSLKKTSRPKLHYAINDSSTNSNSKETNQPSIDMEEEIESTVGGEINTKKFELRLNKETYQPQIQNQDESILIEVLSQSSREEEIEELSLRTGGSYGRWNKTSEQEMDNQKDVTASELKLRDASSGEMDYEEEKALETESRRRRKTEIREKIMADYEEGLKGMVEEINKYYESCWRTKTKRVIKKYVSPAVISMVILIIVFLMMLVIVRLACSFVTCPKIFKTSVAEKVISISQLTDI